MRVTTIGWLVFGFVIVCVQPRVESAAAQTTAPSPAATQANPPASVPPVSTPVEMAKQITEMEAKLADWPQLGRYRADNAALAPVAAGEQRVVFYGDSITDSWGRLPGAGEFFPGKSYVNRG